MHKILSGSRVFKSMLQSNSISQKTYYFSGTKTFWVIQNNSLPLECIKKINKRKNAKQISTFDFSTLYTKISHDKLLDILHKVVDIVFKGYFCYKTILCYN